MLQKSPPIFGKQRYNLSPWHWRKPLPYSRCPNVQLRSWLLGRNSLTSKLVKLSGGQFRVEVLTQVIGKPNLDEAAALKLNRNQLCLVREVILWGCDQPWVFARSLLPLSSLTGRLRHLRKQGNKPLGAYLFQQPDLKRSAIETASFGAAQTYVPKPYQTDLNIWGRRSIFYLDSKPLLVSEVFLAKFPAATLN